MKIDMILQIGLSFETKAGRAEPCLMSSLAPTSREVLDHGALRWESSPKTSALVERESLAATFAGITLVLFLSLLRVSVRWYGEKRLGIQRA